MLQTALPHHEFAGPQSTGRERSFASIGEAAIGAIILIGLAITAFLSWWELRATATQDELLSSDVAGISLQADLEHHVEECRRQFLSMLAAALAASPDPMPAHLAGVREAERQISLLSGKLRLSPLENGESTQFLQFDSEWEAYRSLEGDMIALLLGQRAVEAQMWEERGGATQFHKAMTSLRERRSALDRDAARRQIAVGVARRRLLLALAFFLLLILTGTAVSVKSSWQRRRAFQALVRRNRELRSASGLERERNRVLELIGNNQPLETICDTISGIVDSRHGEACCGIAVVRNGSLQVISAPRLPVSLVRALNSAERAAGSSPIQQAFHTGKPVIAASIENEPLWRGQRDELLQAGFVGSWSLPLQSNAGSALGAITLFVQSAEIDEAGCRESLEMAAGMASLAVQHRRVYEQLAYQAQHDSLTELANRELFQERIENAVVAADTGGSVGFAVLLLDLDDFKQVNDTLGHAAGDALLRQVSHRLRRFVRGSDTVARLGGDEFAILLNQIGHYAEALVVVDKVLEALRSPLRLPGKPVVLTASIGVSVHPEDGRDAATLLKNADMAMYRAKRAGKDKAQRFLQGMADEMNERMEMDSRLRSALANRELSLVYQPELQLDGSIVAMETLLRWDSPTLGKVSPAQFIPVAESSGLIVPIGTWVLREACRQCVLWQKTVLPELRIAVNMSVIQLEQSDVAETVRGVLLETGLNPACLQLEITESYLVRDAAEAKVQLRSLRSLGLTVAIDDFGTGYSSLSYLRNLPVDTLKIDQSFIRDVATSSSSRSVVQAVIGLAHGLSMDVVAEGVETVDQLDVLNALGCDIVQGYLFSRPLPASDLNLRQISQPLRHGLNRSVRSQLVFPEIQISPVPV